MADTPIYDRLVAQIADARARLNRVDPELFRRALAASRFGRVPVIVLGGSRAYPCCQHCEFDEEIVHSYPCPSCQWRAPKTDERDETDASR